MNQNDVRKAIDTRLSGLSLSPRMQAEIRSRAHGNAQPHMRRKLSMSLAFALLALLLAATAGAAAYFGVTRFHAERKTTPSIRRTFWLSANRFRAAMRISP